MDAADRDFSRTTIVGTGLDVWEVVAKTRARGRNVRKLQRYYSWLPEAQIRSALTYYQLYPEEIDARPFAARRP